MATLTKGKTFTNGELVTPATIHLLVDAATISGIVNADIAANAAIADTKLAQITTAGKVANSATTATNANTGSAIVARDASGNFSAGTITANLTGTASGNAPSIHTHGNITNAGAIGMAANLPVVTTTGGLLTTLSAGTAGQVLTSNGGTSAPSFQSLAATSTNATNLAGGSAGTVPYQSASGTTAMLAVGTTGQVLTSNGASAPSWASVAISNIDNADIATNAAIADTKLAQITTAGKVANSATTATNANTGSAIVARDASGNFSAGTITANLTGTASGNAPSIHTHGNITNAGAIGMAANLPVVTTTGGLLTTLSAGTAGQVLTSNGGTSAPSFQSLAATSTNATNLAGGSAGTVPYQSASGTTAMLAVGTTGQVLTSNGASAPSWASVAISNIDNADIATNAAIADTKLAQITTAGKVANSATTATNANTGSAIVARDASGNFSAGTITANLTGTASGNAPSIHTHSITDVTNLQTELDSKVSGSNLGLVQAWVNFNHGRMLGVTNAANGESIAVTSGSSSGTWNSTTAFSTGQIGVIYYVTSAGAVPNASLGGINVSTLGFQIRAISGNTATISLLAGPATSSQTISGNGGTSGFQYMSYGIRSQYGVASIIKTVSGTQTDFTFNFSTAFNFIDYCYFFQLDAKTVADIYVQTKGQSSIMLRIYNFNDSTVCSQMNFMALGI
jgi:hypothetical protein